MRRKTNEEFINEIKEKSPSIEVIGTYINQRTKIEVRCNLCEMYILQILLLYCWDVDVLLVQE